MRKKNTSSRCFSLWSFRFAWLITEREKGDGRFKRGARDSHQYPAKEKKVIYIFGRNSREQNFNRPRYSILPRKLRKKKKRRNSKALPARKYYAELNGARPTTNPDVWKIPAGETSTERCNAGVSNGFSRLVVDSAENRRLFPNVGRTRAISQCIETVVEIRVCHERNPFLDESLLCHLFEIKSVKNIQADQTNFHRTIIFFFFFVSVGKNIKI